MGGVAFQQVEKTLFVRDNSLMVSVGPLDESKHQNMSTLFTTVINMATHKGDRLKIYTLEG